MSEQLLTQAEVAELLRLSVKTVRTGGAGTRDLPKVRLGRQVRYRQEDVTKFINTHLRLPMDIRKPQLRRVR